MSLHIAGTAAGTGLLRPLTRSERVELLEAAFFATYQRYGCPLSDAAEALFQAEVDSVYRACLVARRSVPSGILARLRTEATLQHAARQANT